MGFVPLVSLVSLAWWEMWKLMHASRGYDFGYLLKIVSCAALPPTEAEFFELLRIWFPCIWDIKVRSNSRLF